MKKKINIEGMSCNHCVNHVKNALLDINGVNNVDVDLKGKYAILEGSDVSDEAIKEAIEDAGYDVTGIQAV